MRARRRGRRRRKEGDICKSVNNKKEEKEERKECYKSLPAGDSLYPFPRAGLLERTNRSRLGNWHTRARTTSSALALELSAFLSWRPCAQETACGGAAQGGSTNLGMRFVSVQKTAGALPSVPLHVPPGSLIQDFFLQSLPTVHPPDSRVA